MALIDRVKERVEAQVSDAELQLMIDGIEAEINKRLGLENGVMTWEGLGGAEVIKLPHALDATQSVTVVEKGKNLITHAPVEMQLADDDYSILHNGLVLQRVSDGTNPCDIWAEFVSVEYTPKHVLDRSDDVVIQIIQLDLQYSGLTSERAGDYSASFADYTVERENLFGMLKPASDMVMV